MTRDQFIARMTIIGYSPKVSERKILISFRHDTLPSIGIVNNHAFFSHTPDNYYIFSDFLEEVMAL